MGVIFPFFVVCFLSLVHSDRRYRKRQRPGLEKVIVTGSGLGLYCRIKRGPGKTIGQASTEIPKFLLT